MKKLMHKIMLSCDKATMLMEKSADKDISLMERIQLHFHVSMCDGCSNYQKQMKLINDLLNKHIPGITDDTSVQYGFIAALKEDILRKIITQ